MKPSVVLIACIWTVLPSQAGAAAEKEKRAATSPTHLETSAAPTPPEPAAADAARPGTPPAGPPCRAPWQVDNAPFRPSLRNYQSGVLWALLGAGLFASWAGVVFAPVLVLGLLIFIWLIVYAVILYAASAVGALVFGVFGAAFDAIKQAGEPHARAGEQCRESSPGTAVK